MNHLHNIDLICIAALLLLVIIPNLVFIADATGMLP